MCATSSPGRRMSGGILRGRKCRRLKVARKSTSLAMAAARIGTSLACAWSATLWTRDEEGGGRGDDGHCGFQDQLKSGGRGGQFCQEVSFGFVYRVLGGQAGHKSQFRQLEENVARASGGSRSGNEHISIAKDTDMSCGVQVRFTGAPEHCRAWFGEGEPSLGGLRQPGPLLIAIVRFWQPAWKRLGLSARAGLFHRGQAPSGCPHRRGGTLREVSPGGSTSRVGKSALWLLALTRVSQKY